MAGGKRGAGCPVCGQPAQAEAHPFCSRRCADVDLGRWLNGAYAIPAVEPPDDIDAEAVLPPSSNDNRPGRKDGG